MVAQVHQFMCLDDNYGVLLHDPDTKRTAAIDAPEAAPILAALAQTGWTLDDILVTHHHGDHTQGLPALKAAFPQVRIVGPTKEAGKIKLLDETVAEGDTVTVGSLNARVIETPGHTSGHICFWFEADELLFAGDTLFAMGCGRPFEEPAPVLHHSLMKLAALPGSTTVYCGHEYTQSNARFAAMIEPGNPTVVDRAKAVDALRAEKRFTLPTSIGLERATNPFLRAEEAAVRAAVGLPEAAPADVFAALRERKNRS